MKRKPVQAHPVLVIAKAMRDAHRLKVKAEKLHARLVAYNLPELGAANYARAIMANAQDLEMELAEVPKDWKAARGSVGAPVAKGDRVTLKREAAKRYAGIVPAGQVFVVEKIVGNRLVCVADSGLTLPVTRSNVQRVEP